MAPKPLFILLPVAVAGFVATGILLPSPDSSTPHSTPSSLSTGTDEITPTDISEPEPSGADPADVTPKKDKKDKKDKQDKQSKKDKKAGKDTGAGS